jgi:hypothetical protein
VRSLFLLVLLGVTLLVPANTPGQTRPTLRILNNWPLTLRGTQFRQRESVRVTVVMGETTLSRRLQAGALGGFTVRFAGVRLNYCALPLLISARGTVSGLVRMRLPVVDCAMP